VVWVFDKERGAIRDLPIASVAQTPKYYSEDIEKSLALNSEGPGGDVIDKLLSNISGGITESERLRSARYFNNA